MQSVKPLLLSLQCRPSGSLLSRGIFQPHPLGFGIFTMVSGPWIVAIFL